MAAEPSAVTSASASASTTTLPPAAAAAAACSTVPIPVLAEVEDLPPPPKTKAQGHEQWEAFLRERFVRGEDEDFEYERVDLDEEFDVLERTEREEAWFDEESPEWVGEDGEAEGDGDGDRDMRDREKPVERFLVGETGVQDF